MTLLKTIEIAVSAARRRIIENSDRAHEYTGSFNPYGDQTLVLDQMAEDEIISILQTSDIDFAILTEERGFLRGEKTPEYLALVDPIDGSANLARHVPLVSIGISVVPFEERMHSDNIEMSVIESVFSSETYIAVTGKGVTRNGKRVHTSSPVALEDAIISYDIKKTWDNDFLSKSLKTISAVHDTRRTASNLLDLCWTAAGFLDAMVDMRNMLPVIHISGTHMVFEAGGYVIDCNGRRFVVEIKQDVMMNFIAASSQELAEQILKIFNGI